MNVERKMVSLGVNDNREKTFVNEMEVMTAQVGSGLAKK